MESEREERLRRGDKLALETRLPSDRLDPAAPMQHHQWGVFSVTCAMASKEAYPVRHCRSWKLGEGQGQLLAFFDVGVRDQERNQASWHLISNDPSRLLPDPGSGYYVN